MSVIVIGGGLIGVTTAYYLRRFGHEVTVIERQAGPGLETSFANGGLLTPSMSDPWNAPGSWRMLLGSLGRSDSALQVRLSTLPALASWGVGFLRNARAPNFERNSASNLRLARHSLRIMERLRQETCIEYGRVARGSLRIFRDAAKLEHAVGAAHRKMFGGRFRRLTSAEAVELEPALAPIAPELAGALHFEEDETGDAHRFCVALCEHVRSLGVSFRFLTEITSLETHAGRVRAALSGHERIVGDEYIVAAGSYSTQLLRPLGVRLPVRPAKGYSVTFMTHERAPTLAIPVVDDELHAVIVGLEHAVRVAGTAEFAGYDLALSQSRVRNLTKLLQRVLPQEAFDTSAAKPWCGLRAMSMDGVPIIGVTPITNLYVNTGHGHLGWTMAAGSASLLAEIVCGRGSGIDPEAYSLRRFT